jgi:lipid-binding SYLF domain-containing protein
MLVASDQGLRKILRGKLALGADMSVSAGPVGKGKEIATDTALKAEALSYTSSRGLFAGVDLNGAAVDQDFAATASLYGGNPGVPQLLTGAVPAPARARVFLAAVADTFNERASSTNSP